MEAIEGMDETALRMSSQHGPLGSHVMTGCKRGKGQMGRSVTAPPNDWRPPRLAWHSLGWGGVVEGQPWSRGPWSTRKTHHHHVWARRSFAPHEPDIVNVHVRYPPLLLLETHPDTDGNVGGQAAAEPRLFRTEKLWRPSTDSHESEMSRDGGA